MNNHQLEDIKRITDDYLTSQLQTRKELIKQIDTLANFKKGIIHQSMLGR